MQSRVRDDVKSEDIESPEIKSNENLRPRENHKLRMLKKSPYANPSCQTSQRKAHTDLKNEAFSAN